MAGNNRQALESNVCAGVVVHLRQRVLRVVLTSVMVLCVLPLLTLPVVAVRAESVAATKILARNYYYGLGVRQNYQRAFALYQRAAREGDSEAQFICGGMLFKGLGVERDFAAAFTMLHAAASHGVSSPESQQILGQGFLLGSGVPKDYQKAIYWYGKAAESGNAEAQNELGFMYFTGNGVEKDMAKGAEYFLKAARNGLLLGQYNAGILYYTGNGVADQDLKKAYAWFNLAASRGHQPSLAAREQIEKLLSPAEINEAQALSSSLAQQQSVAD